jgi:hypothetical protein
MPDGSGFHGANNKERFEEIAFLPAIRSSMRQIKGLFPVIQEAGLLSNY